MNTIKKWLLVLKPNGEVDIFEHDVNIHIPINRKLDQIGLYPFDVITINGRSYLYVFEAYEKDSKKTKVLISRIGKKNEGEGLIDMQDDDQDNAQIIIEQLMLNTKPILN